ncbi:MAG: PAS domain S-box protein [Proteobacteria bacterium]|nr:MAG: PAS domain S-box protein [Pseudomonadota bacterium]
MQKPAIPASEEKRQEVLEKLDILDTLPEAEFNSVVSLASLICKAPISAISLVDNDRQWFKATTGLGDTTTTSRDVSFCGHTILGPSPFVVPDALLDERFADNPLVTGALGIRFYAGIPLISSGEAIGSLCVIDKEPRQLNAEQIDGLRMLGTLVTSHLHSRIRARDLRDSIEELDAAQDQLLQEERNFQELAESSFDGIFVHDGEKFIYLNQRAAELFERSREELLGTNPLALLARADVKNLGQKMTSRSEEFYEVKGTKLDGVSSYELLLRSKPLVYHGKPMRVAYVQDLTEHRTLQARVSEAESIVHALADNVPAAVFQFLRTSEGDTQFTYLSSAAEQIYETSRDLLMSTSGLAMSYIHPEDAVRVEEALRESEANMSPLHFVGRFQMPVGATKWVDCTSKPRRLAGGVAWEGVMQDITAQRDAENRLEEERAKVIASARMANLGEMAAGLAHEINNAVNYIHGSLPGLERVLSKVEDPELRSKAAVYFGVIRQGTSVTMDIIRSLRASSSLDLSSVAECDLNEVAAAAQTILNQKTEAAGLKVENEIPEGTRIFSSRGGLAQIFLNLIANAADATLNGAGRLVISAAASPHSVLLNFADSGCGIPPEKLSRIFDPFFTTKEVGKGTGLGLFMVRNDLVRLGGTIDCKSEAGRGTTFTVTLPRTPKSSPAEGAV